MEDSAKAQASVIAVVPAMLMIMFTVLMVQLRSFSRLFIVLSVGPLGLIGVVGALLLSGKPLGFVAILGILALLGMITKNAVIIIDQIRSERSQGKDVWQATVDASSTRFRPIMLTAISTVLGMIPIAPTVFWGPMAFAIMGGLLSGQSSRWYFCRRCMWPGLAERKVGRRRRPATASDRAPPSANGLESEMPWRSNRGLPEIQCWWTLPCRVAAPTVRYLGRAGSSPGGAVANH